VKNFGEEEQEQIPGSAYSLNRKPSNKDKIMQRDSRETVGWQKKTELSSILQSIPMLYTRREQIFNSLEK
jgi:hypothetical protein